MRILLVEDDAALGEAKSRVAHACAIDTDTAAPDPRAR